MRAYRPARAPASRRAGLARSRPRRAPGAARAAPVARGRASGSDLGVVPSCSTRSSSVGSAQWTSSKTSTSGRSPARRSKKSRTASSCSPTEPAFPMISSRLSPAWASISRRGRNVAPWPYETQRPTRTVASSPTPATSSRTSRVLPIPGSPTTAIRRGRRASHASSYARRRAASSRLRPTNGASGPRAIGRVPVSIPSRRKAPFVGRTLTALRQSASVASPSRMSPGCRFALEPFPSAHDVARHEPVTDQDLAGVDADADIDVREFLFPELPTPLARPAAHRLRVRPERRRRRATRRRRRSRPCRRWRRSLHGRWRAPSRSICAALRGQGLKLTGETSQDKTVTVLRRSSREGRTAGRSSDGSWRRIACSSSRNAAPGSRPRLSTSARRAS